MPKKTRRTKVLQSKRKEIRQQLAMATGQPQAAAQIQKSFPPESSVRPVSAPTPKAASSPTRYPYVVAELRRIGILAGIMLAILVVLALVLS